MHAQPGWSVLLPEASASSAAVVASFIASTPSRPSLAQELRIWRVTCSALPAGSSTVTSTTVPSDAAFTATASQGMS